MEIDLHGKTHPEGLELIEEYMLLNSTKGSVSLSGGRLSLEPSASAKFF